MLFSRRTFSLKIAILVVASSIAMSWAHAELGGGLSRVLADQTIFRAQRTSLGHGNHMHHELTLPNSGTVKEFTNSSGQIFAVTWSGPGKPDLRQLLGGYFPALQAANAEAFGHNLRRPAHVNRSDLMIQTGGHMGYFWGVAYVPSLAPAGFSTTDLQ